ncbi:MAG: hypothetical protein P4L57_13660 [Rhizomicrobium sp.]|nr:hypothetical protein [Rhizomicrobium sp.]
MRYVLENIEAGAVPNEMKRQSIALSQRVRVVETLNDEMPLAQMAQLGGAFDFLADEPELYSEADIRAPHV